MSEVEPGSKVSVRTAEDRGKGLFAVCGFLPGAKIRRLNIEREVSEERPLGQDDDPDHAFFWDGKLLLVGEPDRYLNHSCDPNSYIRSSNAHGGGIELIARRPIAAGEEITLDYLINNPGGDSWKCGCGSPRCRGEAAGSFFDLPVEIQREYRPLLASWFVERYRQNLEHLEKSPHRTD